MEHTKARFRKGFCHIKCNEYSIGLNEFNMCLKDKPRLTKNDVETLFYKGICLYGMQKSNMALDVFEQVIELNGGSHEEAEEYKKKCEISKFRREFKKKDLFIVNSARLSGAFNNGFNSIRCNTISNYTANKNKNKNVKVYSTGSNKSTSESGNDEKAE